MNPTRLPPGQQLAAPGKWPIVGERGPAPLAGEWQLRVSGLVASPCCWSLSDLRRLPLESREIDIHCVTRWSMLAAPFRGIRLAAMLQQAAPLPAARFVSFVTHSTRAHSTSLPLVDALQLDVLIALDYAGTPLALEHGGPVRSVTPGRYFYKSAKWLTEIELLAEDRLGYWETGAGYHNRADPWREERFVASRISRPEAARIFAQRDLAGKEYVSLDGSDRDLAGLQAAGAILRNADFRRAQLAGANFDRANLSHAQFQSANLRQASLRDADLEGACFAGCDLRGADLRGASLLGALFITSESRESSESSESPESSAPQFESCAILDGSTRMDPDTLEELTPEQSAFVAARLAEPGGCAP